jgi:CRP/FNR family transcriptional regulator, cyclic AMP receptor protein
VPRRRRLVDAERQGGMSRAASAGSARSVACRRDSRYSYWAAECRSARMDVRIALRYFAVRKRLAQHARYLCPMDEARLRSVPLFAELSRRQLGKLAAHVQQREIGSGERLLTEGNLAYEFFVIEEGRAAVVASGKHLTDLGPGDFLGEIALVRGWARTASVIATGPVKALVIDEEGFRRLARSAPSVATQINAAVRERLNRDLLFGLERE